jgi:DNA modification methylase
MSDVEVWQGDCRELMARVPEGLIGAVVTDPPYGIAHSSNYSNYGASWQGTEIAGDHDPALRDWIIEWAEARGLPWAVFGSWKCRRPSRCRGVLIWDKGPAFGMGDLSFPWKMSWEEIYVGGPGWIGRRDEGVLRDHLQVSWESKGRRHPHQKPVSLMARILAKLPRDVVVLDPFLGSGTTLVACLKTGRRGIGIELSPVYCEVARRRVRDAETPLLDVLETTP